MQTVLQFSPRPIRDGDGRSVGRQGLEHRDRLRSTTAAPHPQMSGKDQERQGNCPDDCAPLAGGALVADFPEHENLNDLPIPDKRFEHHKGLRGEPPEAREGSSSSSTIRDQPVTV